jgi:hypothetical protein
MFQKNQTTKIIIFFSVLFLVSSIYLFSIDSRYNDPKYNKDWYSLSFTDPKSGNLNFSIENFSAKNDFHWEVLREKETVSQGDENIQTGEKENITVPNFEMRDAQKYTIRVTSGKDVREIYKNIK